MAAKCVKAKQVSSRKSTLSDYFYGLTTEFQSRYLDKLALCDGIDPYCMKKGEFSTDFIDLPNLQFPDISNYLVVQTSFYSKNQMKAFKSLEAYNFFVSGWVNELGVKRLKDKNHLVFARVNHSQRSTCTPLKTWVIVKEDGEVITAHCNCMAGLAESCSHVGAILYAVEAGVRIRESTTCTMEKSKWLMPSHVKKIVAAPVAEIDFSSAKAKKMKLDKALCGESPDPIKDASPSCPKVKKGSKTYDDFFKALNENCERSAVLMTKKPYHKKFIPKSASVALPKSIMDYQSEESLSLSNELLMDSCKKLCISLTQSQIKNVEEETRKQSHSRIWFTQRAGRITTSKLKSVLCTNPEKPSKSLIKVICYPEAHRFSNHATSYGCKHESQARKVYEKIMSDQHDNFSVRDSGLLINSNWPHMGASPDGVVNCNCCGTGACEIKCPYCHQDKENLASCAGEKGFCLVKGDNDEVQLDRKHSYYYQVQAQINIMEADYCDFLVWNKNDIFVERILPDYELWNSILPKVDVFFRSCILPEVLGKCFTKQMVSTLQQKGNRSV